MLNQIDLQLHESSWLQRNDLQNRDSLITCIRLADINSPPPPSPHGISCCRTFSRIFYWIFPGDFNAEMEQRRRNRIHSLYATKNTNTPTHTARIIAARQLQRTNKNMLKTGSRNFLLKFPCRLFDFVNCNINTIKLPNLFLVK